MSLDKVPRSCGSAIGVLAVFFYYLIYTAPPFSHAPRPFLEVFQKSVLYGLMYSQQLYHCIQN